MSLFSAVLGVVVAGLTFSQSASAYFKYYVCPGTLASPVPEAGICAYGKGEQWSLVFGRPGKCIDVLKKNARTHVDGRDIEKMSDEELKGVSYYGQAEQTADIALIEKSSRDAKVGAKIEAQGCAFYAVATEDESLFHHRKASNVVTKKSTDAIAGSSDSGAGNSGTAGKP